MDKPIMRKVGIVDFTINPFATSRWINDGRRFTQKRQDQFDEQKLLGMHQDAIFNLPDRNQSNYLAFTAIAWGFAVLVDGILQPTEVWEKRDLYNEFGMRKIG